MSTARRGDRDGAGRVPGLPDVVRVDPGGRRIELLDQTALPGSVEYVVMETAPEVAEAIARLRVRGAPAIGIVGALGLSVGLARSLEDGGLGDGDAALARALEMESLLLASRPTGRNLGRALARVAEAFRQGLSTSPREGVERARTAALEVWHDEVERCRRIGEAGLEVIPGGGASVLTHCNAGALATGGLGTATAPLYRAAAEGVPLRIFAGETRPVLQGGRLTAWELARAGLDVTVVTDSMAGSLMARGDVGLVIVGADAVTADGSVVNKIGTYGLAVLARHHGIPFYVAVPATTLDRSLSADQVPIEERAEDEVREIGGRCLVPDEAAVWNPSFDVTPPELVTALVTDAGVIRPPYGPRLADLARA